MIITQSVAIIHLFPINFVFNERCIFVYRKSGLNYSIEHVFNTVESGLRKENVLVKNIFLPYARVCVSNLLRNILYVKDYVIALLI